MQRRKKNRKTMVEINITPFTDIVLVLLIIFMISTPLMMGQSIRVDLPGARKSSQTSESKKNETVTVDRGGGVFINESRFDIRADEAKITAQLSELKKKVADATLIINGDRNCKYDYIIKLIDIANTAGIKKTYLRIEPYK